MQAIQSVPTVAAMPSMQAIRSVWLMAASLCAGAFVLLVATAFSDYVVRLAGGETADWARFFGQFSYTAIPMVLVALLAAARSQMATTLGALGAAALYLLLWVTVAY
jgi:hypothetical protein